VGQTVEDETSTNGAWGNESSAHQPLIDRAYEAFDRGDLAAAREAFDAVLKRRPDHVRYQYMQGLTCKYLRDWPRSLAHNLRSIALCEEPDDASRWNAAIAATALGDWAEARRQWAACGIRIPDGEGAIESDFGTVSLRLNPWGRAETVYAHRIDPVRSQILSIPLPESGYRRGDIVLHDGARTGERPLGDGWVPVFNALQRLQVSEFQTFAAFVNCPSQADLDALLALRVPGIDDLEDWTSGIVHYCLRCSYGAPHRHRDNESEAGDSEAAEDPAGALWESDRNIGIAAQSRRSVTKLLETWKKTGRGRRIDAIEVCDAPLSSPPESGPIWWDSPAEDDEEGTDADIDDGVDADRDRGHEDSDTRDRD
jgi:hypothetical protein